jgi:hypothetical protein
MAFDFIDPDVYISQPLADSDLSKAFRCTDTKIQLLYLLALLTRFANDISLISGTNNSHS